MSTYTQGTGNKIIRVPVALPGNFNAIVYTVPTGKHAWLIQIVGKNATTSINLFVDKAFRNSANTFTTENILLQSLSTVDRYFITETLDYFGQGGIVPRSSVGASALTAHDRLLMEGESLTLRQTTVFPSTVNLFIMEFTPQS